MSEGWGNRGYLTGQGAQNYLKRKLQQNGKIMKKLIGI